MKYTYILFCCLLLSFKLAAQNNIAGQLYKLQHAASDSEKIELYKWLIVEYQRNPDSSAYYANLGIQYAKQRKFPLGEGLIMAQQSVIDENQGRVDLAKQRALYALQIYNDLHYATGIADVNSNLGAIEGEKGNYDQALKYMIKASKIQDSLRDNKGLMITYMNMGSLYLQHDDTANAAKCLLIAETVSKKTPLIDKTIGLYNMIGVLYATEGKLDKALEYFQNDLKLSDAPKFTSSHAESLLYLGNFYHDAGDFKKALSYLNEGLDLAQKKKMPELESNMLQEIALITAEKDPPAALTYLNQALDISKRLDNKSSMISLYKEIADVNKIMGNYKEALIATEQKQKIADSVFSINKAREIASLGAEYDLEKSNVRVKELETLSEKNALQRNIIFFIAAVVIIVLGILLVFFRKTVVLNKQLKEHEQELKELNNMKDKFFSVVGHDLRSPIARIPTILELYEDSSANAEEKKYLIDSLKEHTKASLETLDKLLYWGQSLVKGIRLNQRTFQPNEYIKDAIDLKKIAAAEKHILITNTTPDNVQVFADPTHFDFIIRNLLVNAIKFTNENGKIEVSSNTTSKAGYAVFSIRDNGIGIPNDIIVNIFSSYYTGLGTANERGTGIGLMLCKEFAKQNGGDVWVESEEGKGSTFYFSVKLAA